MRLNVNVGGYPTNPLQPNNNNIGETVVKAAKSSLIFGIIATVLSVGSLFVRLFANIFIRLIFRFFVQTGVGGGLWDTATYTSSLIAIFFVIIATIMAIIGIALYPKASSGRVAQPADKIGLALSIVALAFGFVTLIVCAVSLLPLVMMPLA